MNRSLSPSSSDVPFDDLLQGMNEWRNIQEVIRNTFKSLHEVIRAQGTALQSLERSESSKASKSDLQSGLSKKANITDVNWSLSELTRMIEAKSSSDELDRKADWKSVEAALDLKADRADLQPLVSSRDFSAFKDYIDSQMQSMNEQLTLKMDAKTCRVALDSKATIHDSSLLQQTKVSREELEQLLQAQSRADERTMDELRQQLGRIASTIVSRAEFDDAMQDVHAKIAATADAAKQSAAKVEAATKRKLTQLEERLDVIERESTTRIGQVERELTMKVTHVDTRNVERFESLQGYIEDEIARLNKALASDRVTFREGLGETREDLERMLSESIQQTEDLLKQAARREDVAAALSKKAENAEVDAISRHIIKLEEEIQKLLEHADDVNRSTDNLALALESRTDSQQNTIRATSAAIEEVSEQLASLSKTVASLSTSAQRADATRQHHDTRFHSLESELTRHATQLETTFEKVRRDLIIKANVSDMNIVLDTKANVDDVARSLQQVNSALDQRATQDQLTAVVQEQAVINSAVYSELCMGRWIWQSGVTKTGNTVPWNVQTVNTDPENLLWDRDKVFITVRDPGLYEISFGFFARKKPVVQVLVNSEPAFLISNQHTMSGASRVSGGGRHSAGNITGLTHIDFLALPAKARISISFACEARAEGFLGLRKL